MTATEIKGISPTVSYSKLSMFLECPELFRQKYVVKNKDIKAPLQEALVKGILAHSCIEYILQGNNKETSITLALADWVTNTCGLPINVEDVTGNADIIDFDMLEAYAKIVGKLLVRCSESYHRNDKIRNKDGSAPKSPLDYPPTQFKKEYDAAMHEDSHIYQLKHWLDQDAADNNNSFIRFSFANTAAVAVSYAYLFELPSFVDSIEGIEMNLSDNPVKFRGKYEWNGLIDAEYKTTDGEIIINDHKTEKNQRRPEDVAFDLQLNSYAAVRYEQTGNLPNYIAITHLKSNKINIARTNSDILVESMEYLEQIQEQIDFNIDNIPEGQPWFKKWPSKYDSPCLRRHWKTGTIEQACPHIGNCWPKYAGVIKQELHDYFGHNILD